MISIVLSTVCSIACSISSPPAQSSVEDRLEAALTRGFRAAGVERTESGGSDDGVPRDERMSVAGFAELAWRTPSGGFRFAELPGAECYFGGDDAPDSAPIPEWRDSVAPLSWGDGQLTLRLSQQGGSATARGRLRLRPAQRTGEHSVGRITKVTSGCPMTHEFELPVELGPSGAELDFSWDLHTPVPLGGRRLQFIGEHGSFPGAAIELVEDEPPVEPRPHRLTFEGDDPAVVRFVVQAGRVSQIERIVHPACVGLARIRETREGWEMEFEESSAAYAYHECNAIRVDIVLDGDPQPFERFVGVRHTRPIRDERDARVLWGSFAPGERAELWADGDRVQLVHPDRVACCASLLGSFGRRSLGAFTAPEKQTQVDVELATDAGRFRILGVAVDSVARDLEGWAEVCAH